MPMMSMMSVRPEVDKEVDVAVFAIVARAALPKISGVVTPAVQISCSSPRAQPHAARGALSGFRAGTLLSRSCPNRICRTDASPFCRQASGGRL